MAGLVGVLMTIGFSGAMAEENLSSGEERTLNGHQFMPSQYIVDPFVGTRFGMDLGAASALSLTRDFRDLNDDILFTLEGSVIYATLGMNFQQQLGEKWAIGAGGSALVRSGTSALSFINDGATVNKNVAPVRVIKSGKDIHQGAFSCPVFTQ